VNLFSSLQSAVNLSLLSPDPQGAPPSRISDYSSASSDRVIRDFLKYRRIFSSVSRIFVCEMLRASQTRDRERERERERGKRENSARQIRRCADDYAGNEIVGLAGAKWRPAERPIAAGIFLPCNFRTWRGGGERGGGEVPCRRLSRNEAIGPLTARGARRAGQFFFSPAENRGIAASLAVIDRAGDFLAF
jgi:hypothetical protein